MDSKLYLCQGIKLDKNYTNVVNYTLEQMLTLVTNNSVYESNNLNYIDYIAKTVKVDCPYSTAIECNYMAFQNPRHGNKWYFAFIDDVKYESPKQCTISFTIDVWSTFYNDWSQRPCFVAREHVNNDTIGLHTIDEGLTINNYICEGSGSDPDLLVDGYVAIECTYDPSTQKDFMSLSIINRNVFGCDIYVVRNNSEGWSNLLRFIIACNDKAKASSIINIFQVPYGIVGSQSELESVNFTTDGGVSGTVYKLPFSFNKKSFISKHYDSVGYNCKNNKLKCYPYRYLQVTNNSGNANIYKWEFFEKENNQVEFEIQMAFSVGCSIRAVPLKYKGFDINYDEGVELGKYPNCGWTSDEYTNWLTQNAVNQPVNFLSNMMGATTQAQSSAYRYQQAQAQGTSYNATGDIMNITGNIASSVGNLIASEYSASLLGNKLAGSNMGDVNFASNSLRFDYYNMRLSNEDLKILDDYFSRFGYKINETKIPNITGRRYWNYIQIGESEIIGTGNVASKYMEEINNICRKGVTIWHNHDNIGNYNLNNEII